MLAHLFWGRDHTNSAEKHVIVSLAVFFFLKLGGGGHILRDLWFGSRPSLDGARNPDRKKKKPHTGRTVQGNKACRRMK